VPKVQRQWALHFGFRRIVSLTSSSQAASFFRLHMKLKSVTGRTESTIISSQMPVNGFQIELVQPTLFTPFLGGARPRLSLKREMYHCSFSQQCLASGFSRSCRAHSYRTHTVLSCQYLRTLARGTAIQLSSTNQISDASYFRTHYFERLYYSRLVERTTYGDRQMSRKPLLLMSSPLYVSRTQAYLGMTQSRISS
jgi:hypothetical protein